MKTKSLRYKLRPARGLKAELEKLTPERFNAFQKMLLENITCEEMARRALAEFGIKTSEHAIGTYYRTRPAAEWVGAPEEKCAVMLSRFELLISCPRPGVVGIVVKELPSEASVAFGPEQPPPSPSDPQPPKG